MRVRVLGPLEVCHGNGLLALGGPKQRAVLAVLLARVNTLVSLDEIIDELWGDRPTPSASANARMYAANLRRLLADTPDGLALDRRGTGYVLTVEPAELDLLRFRDLVRRARDLASRSDHAEALALFDEGVALWRGAAVADVPAGRVLAAWRHGLQEERLSVLEERGQALLDTGAFDQASALAHEVLLAQPLRERSHAILIRSRYEAGDVAGALAGFEAARRLLVEQLGVEPGDDLRRLQATILDGAPANRPNTDGLAARPGAIVPRQLPADVVTFTGRGTQLRLLDSLIPSPGWRGPRAVVVSAIAGTAGVGKTALAVHWAHRMADRFPDGQLYVNLRGFDPSGSVMPPAEAVRGFLDALEVPSQRIPAALDAQVDMYRSLMSNRRVLILLDNARDAEQVRPLLPGAPGCFAVVTSRDQLTSLLATEGAQSLALDVLTLEEARQFLARRLGAGRVAAAGAAVDEIIRRCARLPLALAIVAARAAVNPRLPLAALAHELGIAHGRLDALDAGDAATDARVVFSWSYRTLSSEAARLFRLLGLHPGPDISVPAAASLAKITIEHAQQHLKELTNAYLVTAHTAGRYSFHDLLRAYAHELANAMDVAADRNDAVRRTLDHYLHSAWAAALVLHPQRTPITIAMHLPGVSPEAQENRGEALGWFLAEHFVLIEAIRYAATTGFDGHAWQLAWCVTGFMDWRGLWDDQVIVERIGLDAARRLADRPAQANMHRSLGRALARLGRHDEAHTEFQRTLEIFRTLGDAAGQAQAHSSIAATFEGQGRYREMLHHADQWLSLAREIDHRTGQAYALNFLGNGHVLVGEYERALDYCQQALALHQDRADSYGEAATWDSLGDAHFRLGHNQQAATCYEHALRLTREIGDRYHEATVLTHLGDILEATNDLTAARAVWRQALPIFDELGHPDADKVRAKIDSLTAAAWRGE